MKQNIVGFVKTYFTKAKTKANDKKTYPINYKVVGFAKTHYKKTKTKANDRKMLTKTLTKILKLLKITTKPNKQQ